MSRRLSGLVLARRVNESIALQCATPAWRCSVLVSQILIAPGVPRSVKLHVTLWESLTAPPRSLLLTRGIGGRIVFPGPLPEQDVAVLVTDIQRSEDRADAARLLVSAPECVRIYRPEHPMNKESQ